jgi:hypothetical protein
MRQDIERALTNIRKGFTVLAHLPVPIAHLEVRGDYPLQWLAAYDRDGILIWANRPLKSDEECQTECGDGMKWQPIETAPTDNELKFVLVAYANGSVSVATWDADEKEWDDKVYRRDYAGPAITHWMPLPEPPK